MHLKNSNWSHVVARKILHSNYNRIKTWCESFIIKMHGFYNWIGVKVDLIGQIIYLINDIKCRITEYHIFWQ